MGMMECLGWMALSPYESPLSSAVYMIPGWTIGLDFIDLVLCLYHRQFLHSVWGASITKSAVSFDDCHLADDLIDLMPPQINSRRDGMGNSCSGRVSGPVITFCWPLGSGMDCHYAKG